ncbi:MAG: radical SAM protein [Lachnospiraceae bacterium]|nr:radical SAM protein [Lachnospiraceae bacterium]
MTNRKDTGQTDHVKCRICPQGCVLREGQTGVCHARACLEGIVRPLNYGRLTSLALDPVEKKPLARFLPGSYVLSVGTFGCNLRCPFCQNCEISCARIVTPVRGSEGHAAADASAPGSPEEEPLPEVVFTDVNGRSHRIRTEEYTPEELCETALYYRNRGNIGLAFTYNEPMVGMEFVRDTARLVHEAGMKNVLVTAGCITQEALAEVLPCIDAMNIDLKSFRAETYRELLGGDLETVKSFIRTAAEDASTHVELTTLIIPGENDTEEEMREIASWIASLDGGRGRDIPLHVSRFFPRHRMTDRDATPVETVYRLAEIARRNLNYVYTGNC